MRAARADSRRRRRRRVSSPAPDLTYAKSTARQLGRGDEDEEGLHGASQDADEEMLRVRGGQDSPATHQRASKSMRKWHKMLGAKVLNRRSSGTWRHESSMCPGGGQSDSASSQVITPTPDTPHDTVAPQLLRIFADARLYFSHPATRRPNTFPSLDPAATRAPKPTPAGGRARTRCSAGASQSALGKTRNTRARYAASRPGLPVSRCLNAGTRVCAYLALSLSCVAY